MSWRLARSLLTLQAELDRVFPDRVRPDWTIGDPAHRARASDHNPRPGDGAVCAIDVRGAGTARALWEHLLRTRDHRVKYVIFDGRLVSAVNRPWVIRPYRGPNPHRDHLHLSVGRGPDGRSTGPVDDESPWGLTEEEPMTEEDRALLRAAVIEARAAKETAERVERLLVDTDGRPRIPANLATAQLPELRRNLRRTAIAAGVPADQVER